MDGKHAAEIINCALRDVEYRFGRPPLCDSVKVQWSNRLTRAAGNCCIEYRKATIKLSWPIFDFADREDPDRAETELYDVVVHEYLHCWHQDHGAAMKSKLASFGQYSIYHEMACGHALANTANIVPDSYIWYGNEQYFVIDVRPGSIFVESMTGRQGYINGAKIAHIRLL